MIGCSWPVQRDRGARFDCFFQRFFQKNTVIPAVFGNVFHRTEDHCRRNFPAGSGQSADMPLGCIKNHEPDISGLCFMRQGREGIRNAADLRTGDLPVPGIVINYAERNGALFPRSITEFPAEEYPFVRFRRIDFLREYDIKSFFSGIIVVFLLCMTLFFI